MSWLSRLHTFKSVSSIRRCRIHASRNHDTNGDATEFGSSYSIILPPEPHVWGLSHVIPRPVPSNIPRPTYALGDKSHPVVRPREPVTIPLGGDDELRLRRSARLAKDVLIFASTLVKKGSTTNEIEQAIHDFIIRRGAYPSPRLYEGYPFSTCISLNNIIAHGIPNDRPLEGGDTLNIDVTVFLDGYHGDSSRMFLVPEVDDQGLDLCNITKAALDAGIKACGPGKHFRDIGRAIHDLVYPRGYCINQQFAGHGVGPVFHGPPWIIHSINNEPEIMKPGHCFTIEPCIVQGTEPDGWIFPDGWTTSTENGARSAQAEDMVLITEHGADVLTR